MMKQVVLILFLFFSSCKSVTKTETQADNGMDQAVSETWETYLESNAQFEIFQSENDQNPITADVNKDGILDYVVLLNSSKENEENSEVDQIRLSIFEGQKNGSYQLKNQTGPLVPYQIEVTIVDKNVINLKHQSLRHDYELKFKYEDKYKDYMLIGSKYNNYGNAKQEGAGSISSNFLIGKRISTINGVETTSVTRELLPISRINDDNIYELIGG